MAGMQAMDMEVGGQTAAERRLAAERRGSDGQYGLPDRARPSALEMAAASMQEEVTYPRWKICALLVVAGCLAGVGVWCFVPEQDDGSGDKGKELTGEPEGQAAGEITGVPSIEECTATTGAKEWTPVDVHSTAIKTAAQEFLNAVDRKRANCLPVKSSVGVDLSDLINGEARRLEDGKNLPSVTPDPDERPEGTGQISAKQRWSDDCKDQLFTFTISCCTDVSFSGAIRLTSGGVYKMDVDTEPAACAIEAYTEGGITEDSHDPAFAEVQEDAQWAVQTLNALRCPAKTGSGALPPDDSCFKSVATGSDVSTCEDVGNELTLVKVHEAQKQVLHGEQTYMILEASFTGTLPGSSTKTLMLPVTVLAQTCHVHDEQDGCECKTRRLSATIDPPAAPSGDDSKVCWRRELQLANIRGMDTWSPCDLVSANRMATGVLAAQPKPLKLTDRRGNELLPLELLEQKAVEALPKRSYGHEPPTMEQLAMAYRRLGGGGIPNIRPRRIPDSASFVKDVPNEFDPRKDTRNGFSSRVATCENAVPMYDQGQCGSCYSQAIAVMMSLKHCMHDMARSEWDVDFARLLEANASAARRLARGDPASWAPSEADSHLYAAMDIANCDRGCDGSNPWRVWQGFQSLGRGLHKYHPTCMVDENICKQSRGVVNNNARFTSYCSDDRYPSCKTYPAVCKWDKPCSCIAQNLHNKQQTCRSSVPGNCEMPLPIAGYSLQVGNDIAATVENIKRHIWESGPVYAAFYVQPKWDAFYSQFGNSEPIWGVYNGYACGRKEDAEGSHAIVLVGWGEQTFSNGFKAEYWLARNSWGDDWAKAGGYLKIRRGVNCEEIEVGGQSLVSFLLKEPAGAEAYEVAHCDVKDINTPYRYYSGRGCISEVEAVISVECSGRATTKLWFGGESSPGSGTFSGFDHPDTLTDVNPEFKFTMPYVKALGMQTAKSYKYELTTLAPDGTEMAKSDGVFTLGGFKYSQFCDDQPSCEVTNINSPYRYYRLRSCLSEVSPTLTVSCAQPMAGVTVRIDVQDSSGGWSGFVSDKQAVGSSPKDFSFSTGQARALAMEKPQHYMWTTKVYDSSGREVGGSTGQFTLGGLPYTQYC